VETARVCDRCGGIVDVLLMPTRKGERRSAPAWTIGACRSCGATFNPAGLQDLDPIRADRSQTE
jgi:hypothetical protein